MKIMHVAECAGGVDRYLEMLLPLLEDKYEQVFVCSRNFNAEKYRGMVDRVHQLDMRQTLSPLRVAKEVMRLRRIISQELPDMVYCHSSFAGALGRLACMGLKVAVVYNPHGWAFNMQDKSNVLRIVFLLVERMLAKNTDRIVCISEAEYKSAINKGICSPGKLRVIMNGIRIADVVQAEPVSRAALGIKEDDYVVGMVGRLMPQKAPDIFIKAGKLIKEEIPQAVFIIVGYGDETEKVESYAKEYELKLVVTGWVDNAYSYLKTFDVAMLLSRWEGFGLSIAEYMAARKPVVATRVDAIPTLIEDGKDGLLVEVDSPEDVKTKVMYLYHHKEETEELKEKAYQKALRQFDIQRVAVQHIELFDDLGGANSNIALIVLFTSEKERRWAA